MTTGATIHTTKGLNMTVTRRRRPPTIPTSESTVQEGSSLNIPEVKTVLGQKDEFSSACS